MGIGQRIALSLILPDAVLGVLLYPKSGAVHRDWGDRDSSRAKPKGGLDRWGEREVKLGPLLEFGTNLLNSSKIRFGSHAKRADAALL